MRASVSRLLVSFALTLVLCVFPVFAASLAAEPPSPANPPPSEEDGAAKKTAWLTPSAGLQLAAKTAKPLIFFWPGKEAEAAWLAFEREYFGATAFQREMERFIAVRVEKSDDAAIPAGIGSLEDASAIVLLDFRGEILHRWDGELPPRVEVTNRMRKAFRRSEEVAARYASVTRLAEKASYALKLGKCRDAVFMLLEGEKVGVPAGSAPAEDLKRLRTAIDAAYTERAEEAKKAEDAKKLVEALEIYQKMRNDFPLPERTQELDRIIGRIMRQLGFQQ
ncbi:MAG: hypothetical protein L0Z55_10380 [Planctomycetes bacterium]|nr:hypothetical protein [Planctomycetota bacterium]